jgi:hypothetical protein
VCIEVSRAWFVTACRRPVRRHRWLVLPHLWYKGGNSFAKMTCKNGAVRNEARQAGLSEYAARMSILGVPHAVEQVTPKANRFVWAVIVVAGLCATATHEYCMIVKYFQYQVQITVVFRRQILAVHRVLTFILCSYCRCPLTIIT